MAFINGKFVSLEQAYVHVEDRGYQFGDGVYEVVIAYNKIPFALTEHLNRFFNSLELVKIQPAYGRKEITDLVQEALARTGFSNAQIYFHITRGTSKRSHPFPDATVQSNFIITVREASTIPRDQRKNGVAVRSMQDLRWGRCNIKSLNLLPNVMAKQEAIEHGAFEGILCKDGYVTEGSASNVFIVSRGEIITAPADHKILPGVTRMHVIDLCHQLGLKVDERPFTLQELYEAEEAFLTGSGIEVLPINRADERSINEGKVGAITGRLQGEYRRLIILQCAITKKGSFD